MDETYTTKKLEAMGWGYGKGENCMILTSTIFWQINPCDIRMDG